LSPTDRTKYPSLQNSPPQSSFFTSGNCLNTTFAEILFIICTISAGEYRGGADKKQMDIITLYLHRIYLKLVPLQYLFKTHLKSFCQLTPQYHLPIFGNPYHMIFQIVDRLACSFYRAHAVLILCFIASRTCFHPPSRAGRYSTGIFYKERETFFTFLGE
jgi:hypothetical protein